MAQVRAPAQNGTPQLGIDNMMASFFFLAFFSSLFIFMFYITLFLHCHTRIPVVHGK